MPLPNTRRAGQLTQVVVRHQIPVLRRVVDRQLEDVLERGVFLEVSPLSVVLHRRHAFRLLRRLFVVNEIFERIVLVVMTVFS